MPDENQASHEHAILREISEPLGRLPEDAAAALGDVDFPVVLRGYDRIAVDAYVRRATDLVSELQATRSPEAAVRRALERVGDEVSGILQRAHETAAQITSGSRVEAEDRLEQARVEAREITAAAERRVKELDAETDRIWAERQRIVEDAQQLAHQLLGLAGSAAERFPAEDTVAAPPAPAGLAPGAMSEDELSEHELTEEVATFAAPHPGDVTSPTVAFPVPFGEDEAVGEPGGETAREPGDEVGDEVPGEPGGEVPAEPGGEVPAEPGGEVPAEPAGPVDPPPADAHDGSAPGAVPARPPVEGESNGEHPGEQPPPSRG